MEYNYYVYNKPECAVEINKMPIWYKEIKYEGDKNRGTISFNSQNDYDEIWGANSSMEINWEKIERINLLFYKEIQDSIDVYNAIGIVVTKKEKDWIRSHSRTIWFGHRKKMLRKRYYLEKVIHGIFYCEVSERLFNIHTSVIDDKYENFKPYVLKSYSTFICH
ncbi:hypothetical protein LCGC14_2133300 [marine sediment metagenome]|uniref:Uncharacterized protein n=1 Tax=marine sediment metagenome TaxID=412755 RepID=A0A0F9GDR0_9ZZZZ